VISLWVLVSILSPVCRVAYEQRVCAGHLKREITVGKDGFATRSRRR
jgi:hypothetical protein